MGRVCGSVGKFCYCKDHKQERQNPGIVHADTWVLVISDYGVSDRIEDLTTAQMPLDSGINIYEKPAGDWSDKALNAMGATLHHDAAIAYSTVNSYNGLVSWISGFKNGWCTWVLARMAYSSGNRSAML